MEYPMTDPREARRRELAKLTKSRLCALYRTGVRTPDGRIGYYVGGLHPPEQWRKDEVINTILGIEFPTDDTTGLD
jgi:hypothetical protein